MGLLGVLFWIAIAMKSVLFLFFIVGFVAFSSAKHVPEPPCERPLPLCELDPGCYCQYEWIGPKGEPGAWRLKDIHYGSYHDYENWSPAPIIFGYPCDVCFVTIQGPGTTFIDRDTKVNILTIGGRQWDRTAVFLGGAFRNEEPVTLTIGYDDIPIIKRVDGERVCTGETRLIITGQGFGFCPEDLTITVRDATEDRPYYYEYDPLNCDFPDGCGYPGVPSITDVPGIEYNCERIRIFFLDQKIECYVAIDDVYAAQLEVNVQLNIRDPPLSDTVEWLTTYVK